MPLTFVLSPMAEADLEEIWIYTAQEWSVAQAVSYTNDIINGFEAIAAGKKLGGSVSIREGYYKTLIGRHAIYFQNRGEVIAIIRVLHQSMDVDRHL